MQRIIVKNFGPLKDIDLEIKSTLAKLIYFFREYENTVKPLLFKNHNQSHDFTKNEHEQLLNHRFSDLFGDYTFSNETLIYFDFGSDNKLNQSITIFYNSEIKLFISNINIEKIFKQINEELNDDRISSLKIVFGSEEVNLGKRKNDIIAFAGLIIETLGKSHLFNNYFIPSNRAFIAQNYAPLTTDSMMYNFYILVGELKNKFRKNYSQQIEEKKYFNQGKLKNKRILKLYLKLLRSVLKGEYILENQNDFIQLDDNIKLNLRSAASGQQESIWVMNAIFYLLLENNESKIIIEEPEAHLYPEAQKDMTYLISLLANQESNQV
ncbi:MAG: ATP-binding protein, partial [Spirosomaceae bacterium]|nr:ATP-binding protein [Spirosomataceae bacterium]